MTKPHHPSGRSPNGFPAGRQRRASPGGVRPGIVCTAGLRLMQQDHGSVPAKGRKSAATQSRSADTAVPHGGLRSASSGWLPADSPNRASCDSLARRVSETLGGVIGKRQRSQYSRLSLPIRGGVARDAFRPAGVRSTSLAPASQSLHRMQAFHFDRVVAHREYGLPKHWG